MKVIALGGAGQEGSRTVRDLAASAQVESVVIGDLIFVILFIMALKALPTWRSGGVPITQLVE